MSDEQKLKLSLAKKGKKFSPEHIQKLKKSHKGKIPSNLEQLRAYRKGRPLSEEHKDKIRQAQIGKPKNLSLEARLKMSECKKGKPAWNKGLKGYLSGEKNPMWIKDRTKVKQFEKRLGSLYTQWRRECHKRDKYQCKLHSEECSGKLEVHHILRWQDHKELRYDVNNGITLCHFHHPRKKSDEDKMKELFISLIG